MPIYCIVKDNKAMKVIVNKAIFIDDARLANTYPSKYAAKKHLKQLDNVPEDVKIIELLTIEENTNV